MVGRTDDGQPASVRILRRDLVEALRGCDAGKPAIDEPRNRFATLPAALSVARTREKTPAFDPAIVMPSAVIRAAPGRREQIRASFQAELSPDVDEAAGFIGRSFALPELAALLTLGSQAIALAGARLLGAPRTSRRRISASKLKSINTFKIKFVEA